MRNRSTRGAAAVLSVGLVMLIAACGAESGGDSGSEDVSEPTVTEGELVSMEELPTGTEELCGDEEIKLAHVQGFGGNSWNEIVHAELLDELSACPNVEVDLTEAGGDIKTFNAAIDSYTSRGYDIILTLGEDFGPQALPALRRAYNAGLTVVAYGGTTTGKPGEDLTAEVIYNRGAVGEAFGEWVNKVLDGKGNVIFMGGSAGNSSSPLFMEPAVETTDPGIKWLQDEPVTTNWDPAQYQRVTTGLLAEYDKIDAFVSDYGGGSVGQIRAYQKAGKPHPPMASLANSNELGCMVKEVSQKWPDFEVLWMDGSTRTIRWGVRRALAEFNGIELDEPTTNLALFPFVDTTEGDEVPCDESLPPDADLSSGLEPDELKAVFE